MADRLRVEDERILEQASRLEQAIAAYRELGENPLEESLGDLDSMYSSFTERISRMLRTITNANSDFLENIESIKDTTDQIATNLREVDTEIVNSMGGS